MIWASSDTFSYLNDAREQVPTLDLVLESFKIALEVGPRHLPSLWAAGKFKEKEDTSMTMMLP